MRIFTAKELVADGDKVVGVKVEAPNGSYAIKADAVVVATGAFGSNKEMVEQYLPNWAGYSSTEVDTATGDGIIMGQKVGAALKGMDEDHLVVYSCCAKVGDGMVIPIPIRAAGGIIVNKEGRRFHDELDAQFSNLGIAAREQPEGRYFGIVDQAWIDKNAVFKTAQKADTLEELAEKLGIDPKGLADECAHYNEMYEAGEDTDFHRLTINDLVSTPPFYGAEVFTGLHGFDGGLAVDRRMQVLKEDGTPIPGLYAGGGVEFGLATQSAMTGKIFTAFLLSETLLEELGY